MLVADPNHFLEWALLTVHGDALGVQRPSSAATAMDPPHLRLAEPDAPSAASSKQAVTLSAARSIRYIRAAGLQNSSACATSSGHMSSSAVAACDDQRTLCRIGHYSGRLGRRRMMQAGNRSCTLAMRTGRGV